MPKTVEGYIWAAVTLVVYAGVRAVHRKLGRWWTAPMFATLVICGLLIVATGTDYRDYFSGTSWLVLLLGPATVAFAVPIYRHRVLIRKHWLILAVGVLSGCVIAIASSWILASLFDIPPRIRASLLPRSVTTPFAMAASQRIGGMPDLTAGFTAVTGIFGSAVGELLLECLPFRSVFARGALFGMGAHGAGVAKALELGQEEGAIAGLIMIFAGLITVIAAAIWSSLHPGW